jgi:prepilin-type N-terminal cleavage/methylation domain-containing protein
MEVNVIQRAVARRYDEESGMTLIELMIVILILGVLAAIIVLGVGAFQSSGDSVACKTTSQELQAAAAAAYAKNGAYTNWANYVKGGGTNKWGLGINTSTGDVTGTCPT